MCASVRVMARLNLTLDDDTAEALDRHARRQRRPRAVLARELIREALEERETRARRAALARDYAAERVATAALLSELEAAQVELLDEP